ncbi:MAG: 3-deoxy-D-manno-octulosonic acid transferase, partial [Gemmatimonadales bacterium]
GLQAEAVLVRLRRRHPDWQFAYTYFSPSAEALADRLEVDVAGYLPYDLPGPVEALLDILQPRVLAFTKLDLWPELATRAARRGVAVALISGTVRPGSGRLHWPSRSLLAPGYRSLTVAAAVSVEDGGRLQSLGVPADRVRVLGDPRFDSVLDRVNRIRPDDPLLRFGAGAPTLVAGSTWPGDEAVLLDAFARLHVHRPDARLILVPHEPTEAHVSRLEREASRVGLPSPVRLSAAERPVPLLLVDLVGVLATLYGAGTIGFVGGGFHGAGLHSVLEPAAWSLPVVFGPRWTQSRDAELLLQAGGAEALAELGTDEAGEALQRLWEGWMVDGSRRAAQGRMGRAAVEAGAGAGDRLAGMLEELATSPPLPLQR